MAPVKWERYSSYMNFNQGNLSGVLLELPLLTPLIGNLTPSPC